MEPVQVLRLERDKLSKEHRRIQSEIDKLDQAIELLAGKMSASDSEKTAGVGHTGSTGSVRYGGWRDLVLRLLQDKGRFVRSRALVDAAVALYPKQTKAKVQLAVKNALFGLRGKKVVVYRVGSGNHGVFWGLMDFADPVTGEPKKGREPLDDFDGLDFLDEDPGHNSEEVGVDSNRMDDDQGR